MGAGKIRAVYFDVYVQGVGSQESAGCPNPLELELQHWKDLWTLKDPWLKLLHYGMRLGIFSLPKPKLGKIGVRDEAELVCTLCG